MGQQNMNKKKVSMINGFANAINLPRYSGKDGDFPLYPHGEGSKVLLQRPQGWFKETEHTYNSPSNARVVCLSNDGANILYWAPPVKDGKLSGQLEIAGAYVFDKTAKAGVKQRINHQLYTWENAGLQALVNPVVFSNLEELWVSVEVLACPQYAQYYNQLCGLKPGQVSGATFLATILENEISTPTKRRTIADTFPLLRAIVVVQTSPNSPVQDFHKCAVRTEEIKTILETKFPNYRRSVGENADIMRNLANQTGFGFAVCPILSGDVLKFSLGDYKYDQKVLSGLKDKLIQKYGQLAAPVKDAESVPSKMVEGDKQVVEVASVATGISVLESYLNKAEASGKSANRMKLILSAYAAEYGDESLKSEYASFTPEGKKRYAKLFD